MILGLYTRGVDFDGSSHLSALLLCSFLFLIPAFVHDDSLDIRVIARPWELKRALMPKRFSERRYKSSDERGSAPQLGKTAKGACISITCTRDAYG